VGAGIRVLREGVCSVTVRLPEKFLSKKKMNNKRKGFRRKKLSFTGQPSAAAKPDKSRRVTNLGKAQVKRRKQLARDPRAAYEQLLSDELCISLAGKFARESAEATGDDTGTIRFRYDRIVTELRCLRETQSKSGERRSLSDVLRGNYGTDDALKQFLPMLRKWIDAYVSECIHTAHSEGWKLYGHAPSRDLMNALALEYVRDRDGLMRFLSAVFKYWRSLFARYGSWRVRLVTQQIAPLFKNDRKRILDCLQKIGAVPKSLTSDQYYSWLSRIGQYLSRDQRTAAGKDFGFRRGPTSKKESQ
jgi:hypothetical protein